MPSLFRNISGYTDYQCLILLFRHIIVAVLAVKKSLRSAPVKGVVLYFTPKYTNRFIFHLIILLYCVIIYYV